MGRVDLCLHKPGTSRCLERLGRTLHAPTAGPALPTPPPPAPRLLPHAHTAPPPGFCPSAASHDPPCPGPWRTLASEDEG